MPSDDEGDIFARIQSAAQKLNSAADEASAYIRSVNERLKAAGVGTEVVLRLFLRDPVRGPECAALTSSETYGDTGQREVTETFLGYTRSPRSPAGWELGILTETTTYNYDDPAEEEETHRAWEPLEKANRETRIKALPYIRHLLKEIERELTSAESSIRKALQ